MKKLLLELIVPIVSGIAGALLCLRWFGML